MQLRDAIDFYHMPRVLINLMFEKTAENDSFYTQLVQNFYQEAQSRHPKVFFVRKFVFGVALFELPKDFDAYFKRIEASARRNYRKAERLGYKVRRFDFNSELEQVREILQSTPVRQGELPRDIREGRVRPIADPPSRTSYHDYPYFGVFKEGKLLAYAACMISGELCNLNDLYGHSAYLSDGVVPMLIVEIFKELLKSYPAVKYYSYGTHFGASVSMRRFKRKFLFHPHRVAWILKTPLNALSPREPLLIYRRDVSDPPLEPQLPEDKYVIVTGFLGSLRNFSLWARNDGWFKAFKTSLKICSGRRLFFGVLQGNQVVQSGWANLGFCRYYPVERNSVVLGTLWTKPEVRGRGLASAAMRHVILFLYKRGYRRFYIDTTPSNIASQRMIAKAGFSKCIDEDVTAERHDFALV